MTLLDVKNIDVFIQRGHCGTRRQAPPCIDTMQMLLPRSQDKTATQIAGHVSRLLLFGSFTCVCGLQFPSDVALDLHINSCLVGPGHDWPPESRPPGAGVFVIFDAGRKTPRATSRRHLTHFRKCLASSHVLINVLLKLYVSGVSQSASSDLLEAFDIRTAEFQVWLEFLCTFTLTVGGRC